MSDRKFFTNSNQEIGIDSASWKWVPEWFGKNPKGVMFATSLVWYYGAASEGRADPL